jgi:hypothetical protein
VNVTQALYNSANGTSVTGVLLPFIPLSTTTGFTVSFWFYPMTTSVYGTIWTYGNNARIYIGMHTTTTNTTDTTVVSGGTSIAFTLNTWVFYTLVQPANNGQPYIFQNTTKVLLTGYGQLSYTTTTINQLFRDVDTKYGMKGYISNFVIYQFALSDAQVTQLYNS